MNMLFTAASPRDLRMPMCPTIPIRTKMSFLLYQIQNTRPSR